MLIEKKSNQWKYKNYTIQMKKNSLLLIIISLKLEVEYI